MGTLRSLPCRFGAGLCRIDEDTGAIIGAVAGADIGAIGDRIIAGADIGAGALILRGAPLGAGATLTSPAT